MPQELRFKVQTIRGVIEPWEKLPELSFFEYAKYRENKMAYFALPNAPIYY